MSTETRVVPEWETMDSAMLNVVINYLNDIEHKIIMTIIFEGTLELTTCKKVPLLVRVIAAVLLLSFLYRLRRNSNLYWIKT